MSDSKKPMSLMAASKDYFGLLPNQTAMDFLKEFKGLNEKDKEEVKAGLEKVGYTITASPAAA